MISYIEGKITDHSDGKCTVLLEMGASKIGYQLHVPQSSNYNFLNEGEVSEFFIHSHVREDAFDLYGFKTKIEKEVFLTLLTVNGIGPKGALGILSKIELETLMDAIFTENKEALTSIPGIGKKTAERMMIELKDPLKKKFESGLLGHSKMKTNESSVNTSKLHNVFAKFIEAKEALLSLGYKENEIQFTFRKLEEAGLLTKDKTTSEVIKLSLKELH